MGGWMCQRIRANYRVTNLPVNLGWVDLDLGCSTILPTCSATSARFPPSPGRTMQRVQWNNANVNRTQLDHEMAHLSRRISVFFPSLCYIWTWIWIIFRSKFVACKLPLHPLVSKQTSLVLAAVGLSCSQSRVNWWRNRKFVSNKISAKIKLNPTRPYCKVTKKRHWSSIPPYI